MKSPVPILAKNLRKPGFYRIYKKWGSETIGRFAFPLDRNNARLFPVHELKNHTDITFPYSKKVLQSFELLRIKADEIARKNSLNKALDDLALFGRKSSKYFIELSHSGREVFSGAAARESRVHEIG